MRLKRRRIYYIPGIISLIGITIIFYFLKPEYKQQYGLRLNLPTDAPDDENIRFSSQGVLAEAIERKQTIVELNSDSNLINQKLSFIEHEIIRLNSSYSRTAEVLIVKLNPTTLFSNFVLLIEFATKVKLKRYAYVGDDFYFFGIEKPVEDKSTKVEVYSITCGYIPFVQEKPHPKFYDVFFAWFRKTIQKENAWWLAGYLLLIFIPSIVSTKIVRKIPLKNL